MSAFTIHLTVTGAEGAPRVPLTIEPTITSTELRERAAEATNIPLDSLKLIFRGRLIGSNETLQAVTEFKLEDGSVLHCMGKPASVASSLPSVSSSSATENSSSAAAPVAALPTNVLPFTAPPSIPVSVPVSTADPLSAALATLRAGLSPAEYLTAVQTIEKIVSNIVTQPMEEKYRSLKKSNAAFQRKLGGKNGGDAVMRAAGFTVETREEGIEYYALQASADAWPKLLATQSTLQTVVRQAQAAIVTPVAPFIPPIGGGHSLSPNMNQAAADFLSNPAQVQAMLQNPMVQNMLRNDPRFANNPAGQQMLEQMLNNPAMLQQASQMMRDPAMMQRMQQMTGSMGNDFGGFGGSFGGMPASVNNSAGGNPNNNTATRQQGASDEQMTEEEMIAEAIRRSLQDGS